MPQVLVISTDASGSGNAAYFSSQGQYKQVFPLLNVLSFRQLYWLVRTLLMFLSICTQTVPMYAVWSKLLKPPIYDTQMMNRFFISSMS
jgi:hypothetical protein